MNKIQLATRVKIETREKLQVLANKKGWSMGQVIDYMTEKQKYIK